MAITTYGTLETAVENWAKRTDLTSRIAEFIVLTEERIWYGDEDPQFGNEPLRVREMETTTDLSIGSSGTASIPSGYLQGKRLYMLSSGVETELVYYPPTDFYQRTLAQGAGVAVGYTIEGDNFVFGDKLTGTPKLLYYQKLDALDSSDSSSTNTILTTRPSIYLFGALLELQVYIKEWDEALFFAKRFRNAINGWNAGDQTGRYIGPLVPKPVAVA